MARGKNIWEWPKPNNKRNDGEFPLIETREKMESRETWRQVL